MFMYRADKFERPPTGRVFRQSRVAHTVLPLLIWGGAIALAIGPYRWGLSYWVLIGTAFLSLLGLPLFGFCRRVWSKRNWTMVIGDDALYLNIRSFGNLHFDGGDTTVAQIPFTDIEWARRYSVRLSESTSDGQATWTRHTLELKVRCDTSELELACFDEQANKGPKRGFGVTWHTRSNHVPMRVPEPGMIRVMFRGRADLLRPGLGRALTALAPRAAIDEAMKVDKSDLDAMTEDEFAAMVLDRCDRGQKISAVRLLRERYGYSLKEAMRFVDEIVGRDPGDKKPAKGSDS